MLLKKLKTIDVEGLSSARHLQLLDSIDKLRSQGIDHYISLPQIIVCGDQSSGKSSVLEAISGVPFPVKSNLCTRFPIELVLRKTPHTGIRVSIIRHQDGASNNTNRSSVAEFEEKLDSYEDLPSLIEAAKTAMGVVTYGKAFSKDTLHIEISGPNHPHLTIVDLPGLIHSETRHQSESDIELIQDVVRTYMKKQRTLVLAVVSAKNDYANQIVLKLARLADPNGSRTLGVITKPDTLLPGSLSERTYISLARNKEIEFRLGWHVLKNMDSEAGICSLPERDALEAQFFSEGAWADLPESSLGIKKLRDRLSNLLFNQIAVELPKLIEEIEEKATICQESLRKLGQPRTTLEEQRMYIFEVSDRFNKLLKAAIDGSYDGSFFGDAETASGYQRHLRAVIQNLNEEFSTNIVEKGCRYVVTSIPSTKKSSNGGMLLTRKEFIAKVINLMKRSRGRELSGMFDPMIVSKLFREQSSPWADLVMAHVKNVWTAAKVFLEQLTAHVADASTIQIILRLIIEPKLSEILGLMREKTNEILQPLKEGHPITYNQSFLETVAEIRSKRKSEQISSTLKGLGGSSGLDNHSCYINLSALHKALLTEVVEKDERQYVASQVLDYLEAYYQIALQRFIDDISVEVIEMCLVRLLEQVFNTLEVVKMPKDTVARIAGETDKMKKIRQNLQKQLDTLAKGLDTCRDYVIVDITTPHDVEGNPDTEIFEGWHDVVLSTKSEGKEGGVMDQGTVINPKSYMHTIDPEAEPENECSLSFANEAPKEAPQPEYEHRPAIDPAAESLPKADLSFADEVIVEAPPTDYDDGPAIEPQAESVAEEGPSDPIESRMEPPPSTNEDFWDRYGLSKKDKKRKKRTALRAAEEVAEPEPKAVPVDDNEM